MSDACSIIGFIAFWGLVVYFFPVFALLFFIYIMLATMLDA